MGITARYTTGMTTAKWLQLPITWVPPWGLTPTQAVYESLWPAPRPNPVASGDACIHVVQLGEVLYVEDGHHRLARARRDHLLYLPTRILRVD